MMIGCSRGTLMYESAGGKDYDISYEEVFLYLSVKEFWTYAIHISGNVKEIH